MIFIIILFFDILFALLSDYLFYAWTGYECTYKVKIKDIIVIAIINLIGALICQWIFEFSFSFYEFGNSSYINLYYLTIIFTSLSIGLLRYKKYKAKGSANRNAESEESKPYIKWSRIICLLGLIACLSEIVVFNYRHFDLAFLKKEPEILLDDITLSIGSGFVDNLDGTVTALASGDKTIELLDINRKVENVYFDCVNRSAEYLKFNISITDEANTFYTKLTESMVINKIEKSKYLRLHTRGVSEKILVSLNGIKENDILAINHISLNVHRPIYFSLLRFLFLFLILCVGYAIRPSSELYKYTFDLNAKWQKSILITGIMIQMLFSFWLISLLTINVEPPEWHGQYHQLTDSLLKGQAYLDIEPSPELVSLKNPYDITLRRNNKVEYQWDTAYYEGKYYVYFGITPVLLFYLPFKMITGQHLPNYFCVYILFIIFALSTAGFISQIIKKYFNRTSFIIFMLLTFLFINSCGSLFVLVNAYIYAVPTMGALSLGMAGLYFWISSIRANHQLCKWRLFFGSLCVSLISGCRPQLLVVSLFAFPIFWNVFKQKLLFSKTSVLPTLSICLPFVFVGLGMMYYNFIRFGSIFDFGSHYNLTVDDMTQRGIVLGRIPIGIWMYYFQPPNINSKFPFIFSSNFYSSYLGIKWVETLCGGILTNSICLFSLLFLKLRRQLKEKGLFLFVCMNMLFSILIAILDIQVGGIIQRYSVDFAWFIFVASIIVILLLAEITAKLTVYKRALHTAILSCFYTGFTYNFLLLFNANPSDFVNQEFYYQIARSFEFWL